MSWYQKPVTPNASATPLFTSVGNKMKTPVKKISAIAIVQPMALDEMRSSSGIWRSADQASALNPRPRDSASAVTPRTTGIFDQRSDHVGASWVTTSIPPSGSRTATAQVWAPRIMTPSTTACPPM